VSYFTLRIIIILMETIKDIYPPGTVALAEPSISERSEMLHRPLPVPQIGGACPSGYSSLANVGLLRAEPE
jgi:hypothetical protein